MACGRSPRATPSARKLHCSVGQPAGGSGRARRRPLPSVRHRATILVDLTKSRRYAKRSASMCRERATSVVARDGKRRTCRAAARSRLACASACVRACCMLHAARACACACTCCGVRWDREQSARMRVEAAAARLAVHRLPADGAQFVAERHQMLEHLDVGAPDAAQAELSLGHVIQRRPQRRSCSEPLALRAKGLSG